jgi:DNA-binding XRE family transcriptional regulator
VDDFAEPAVQHVVAQLALLRNLNGMTKTNTAVRVGVSVGVLDGWETGRVCPTVAQADAYANLFGLTIGLVVNVEETDGNA